MNFFEFPTPFIFSDKVEDHEEIKENILPLLFEFEEYHTHKTHHLQEGDVILFPSELPHYVLPATQKKRVTISFNIKNIFD